MMTFSQWFDSSSDFASQLLLRTDRCAFPELHYIETRIGDDALNEAAGEKKSVS